MALLTMSQWLIKYRNFRTISRGLYVVFGHGKVSCGLYKGRLICRRLKNKTGKDRFYCPRRCNYNTYATYRKSGRAQATGPKAFETSSSLLVAAIVPS